MLDLKVENVETWGLEVFSASFAASRRTALPLRVPELTDDDARAVCL